MGVKEAGQQRVHPAALGAVLITEQGVESCLPIQREQLVAAADVFIVDKDLRHALAAAAALHHLPSQYRLLINPNLFVNHFFLIEKRFGANAVRAVCGAVDDDFGHDLIFMQRKVLSLPFGDST